MSRHCLTRFWSIAVMLTCTVPARAAETDQMIAHVRSVFKQFSPSDLERRQTLILIRRLGDKRFAVREAAMNQLLLQPVLPIAELEQVVAGSDAERRARAALILERRAHDHGQQFFFFAFHAISQYYLKGLAADVIDATVHIRDDSVWNTVTAALTATAESDDVDLLRGAIADPRPRMRIAAARALLALLHEDAIADLLPLLEDEDMHVRLEVARALADLGERAALETLVELLDAPQLRIRWHAIQTLRGVSRRKFDYSPAHEEEQRRDGIAQWRKWLESEGQTAKLYFPVQVAAEQLLFNGKDMDNWVFFVDNAVVDPDKTDEFWSADDGVLTFEPFYGYARTREEYLNYRLSLEYRWPEGSTTGDGGIHIFQTGPDSVRPTCLEVQTHCGNAGDFYRIGSFQVAAGGELRTGVRSRLQESSEKPIGQWNKLVIQVTSGVATVHVNDVLQNKATGCPQDPGAIAFRVERYSFDVRDLTLLPLD